MSDVFVGRRRVLEQLSAKLDEAFEGRGAVVMLAGELGIGKSAIARELTARARRRGATVLAGACFEGDWQPPYAPWVQALRPYLERAGLAGLLGASAAPLPPDEARLRLSTPSLGCLRRSRTPARWCSCSTTCTGPTPTPCGCFAMWHARPLSCPS